MIINKKHLLEKQKKNFIGHFYVNYFYTHINQLLLGMYLKFS